MHGHGGRRGGHGGSGHAGGGGGHGDGRRMRRGQVPDLLLVALLDGPAHGYELMDRLERFSGGSWRPSPGSVYPLLQMFQDRGLVESDSEQGRKVFALTEAGREEAERHRVDVTDATVPVDSNRSELRTELEQLRAASRQVSMVATPEQLAQAVTIVRGARQALYRMLAEQ
jgi:DNA-binding PadR family transcriptional regulator